MASVADGQTRLPVIVPQAQMPDRHKAGDAFAWNVLVTATEGAAADLRRELRRLGDFRWSDFRNVILGHTEDPRGFLAELTDLLETKPFVAAWLGKALPVEVTFAVVPERFEVDAREHLAPLLSRIAGRSFHVRVERRGHKGVLHTHEMELRLADFLVRALIAAGHEPAVTFSDPEVIVAVEIVGRHAGLCLATRELRRQFPIVKID